MPRNHWPKPRNYFTAQRFAEGGALEDPARFAELLAERLARTL